MRRPRTRFPAAAVRPATEPVATDADGTFLEAALRSTCRPSGATRCRAVTSWAKPGTAMTALARVARARLLTAAGSELRDYLKGTQLYISFAETAAGGGGR